VIGGGLSATMTVRVPLYRDVNGYQPVPGLGGVLALNWSWDSAPAPQGPKPALEPGDKPKEAAIAQVLVAGKTTMVEYGATWCAVCKKLKPKLAAFAATREDVVFRHIDVTDWDVPRMKRVLPAQPGLPVLDIFGPDGRLIKRLWGEQTFKYAEIVPAAPAGTKAAAAPVATPAAKPATSPASAVGRPDGAKPVPPAPAKDAPAVPRPKG